MLDLHSTPLVSINHQRVTTTSLLIAEAFDRQHKNILRDIERLECSQEFNRLNFEPISYKDEMNRMQPAFNITRDGFTFLAMGFTGAKAAQFKEAFIEQFNRMERMLASGSALAIQNTPQNPVTTKVTVNTSELVREAHKGNRFAQRLLHHLTGMQIDDIAAEVEHKLVVEDFKRAELAANYLDILLKRSERFGIDLGVTDDSRPYLQGLTSQYFHAFKIIGKERGLPMLGKSLEAFGQVMAKEAAGLEFYGWRRSLAKRLSGARFFRFERVGGEA